MRYAPVHGNTCTLQLHFEILQIDFILFTATCCVRRIDSITLAGKLQFGVFAIMYGEIWQKHKEFSRKQIHFSRMGRGSAIAGK